MEFLSRIRVEHAKTLLRRSDTKVIDIALERVVHLLPDNVLMACHF